MAEEQPGEEKSEGKGKAYVIKRKSRMSTSARFGIGALVLGGFGVVVYPYVLPSGLFDRLETSRPDEFQDPDDGSGFGSIRPAETATEAPIRAPEFDPGPIENELEAQRLALEAQNQRLAQDVATLQAQLAEMANAEPDNSAAAAMAEAIQAVQAQNAALIAQLQEQMDNRLAQADLEGQRRIAAERSAREEAAAVADERDAAVEERARQASLQQQQLTDLITQLQRENQALSDQMQGGMDDALREQAERDRLATEERERRAVLEARQAEARARREAQIASEAVVFDAGGAVSPSPGDASVPAGSGAPVALTGDAASRAFVLEGARPVTVTSAEVIANPGNTILQGTIIQASLETAVDSSLPGQIIAIVNRPVWSFSQSRVLIPQGSRLFGSYSSDISLGQSRILVGWTRLVTPEGQSVELAAFGADDQGRSGVKGEVNNRFGLRFGTSALLSIIGAVPSLASVGQNSDAAATAVQNVGENFAETTNSVIGEYATLPPIISLQPGAAVSVIVDRDLEFY